MTIKFKTVIGPLMSKATVNYKLYVYPIRVRCTSILFTAVMFDITIENSITQNKIITVTKTSYRYPKS